MTAALIIAVLIIGAIAGGVLVWLRTRGLYFAVRVLLASLPLGAAVAIFFMIWILCTAPRHDWNGAKLAPVVAMVRGNPDNYRLYQDPLTGVMTAWIYGPVPALMFLPAAMFQRPTGAIISAALINLLAVLVPSVWLILRLSARGAGKAFSSIMILLLSWIMLDNESIRRAALMVSPDGPTIGMAICSLTMLLGAKRGPRQMALAALFAALACWCKQSAIPFLIIPPLLVLALDGAIAAASYVLIQVIVGIVVSGIFMISFGPLNMWFHMVTISSTHGFNNEDQHSKLVLTIGAIQALLSELVPTVMLMVLACLLRRVLVPPQHRQPWRGLVNWIRENPWLALPATAIVLAPSSLLGYLKVGGYINNFALTHIFVGLTVCAMYLQLCADIRDASTQLLIPPRQFLLATLSLVLLIFWPKVVLTKGTADMYRSIRDAGKNQQEQVYEIAEKFPGRIYFPWNPLSVLLAEGKLYHFEWGAFDRYAANNQDRVPPPTTDQIVAHIPPKDTLRFIAFGPLHQQEFTVRGFDAEGKIRWFPLANKRVTLQELPDFTVYSQ